MAAITYQEVAQEMDALGVGAQGDVRALIAGAGNPWDSYVSVPIGSRYFKSDGTTYWKSGSGDTSGDWTLFEAGGDPDIEDAVSEGQSTRTFTTYAEKVSLTFTAEASDYLIWWYAEVQSQESGTRVETRVQIDNTTTIHETDWHPDTGDNVGWGPVSGFYRATLTAASHDIDMDYSSSQSGKAVAIRRARIVAMKVA